VGDVGGRAAPLGDGLERGGLRELRDGRVGHVYAAVEGRQGFVGELRVGGERFLGQVEVPFVDACFLAWKQRNSPYFNSVIIICSLENITARRRSMVD
jgi:hypothetical protein